MDTVTHVCGNSKQKFRRGDDRPLTAPVAWVIRRLIRRDIGKPYAERLRAYADVKQRMSRYVGWDADPRFRDDDQYNRAMTEYVKAVRL